MADDTPTDRAVTLYRRLHSALSDPPTPRRTAKVRALTRRINAFLEVAPAKQVQRYYERIWPIGRDAAS
jgi:hypothetical protein